MQHVTGPKHTDRGTLTVRGCTEGRGRRGRSRGGRQGNHFAIQVDQRSLFRQTNTLEEEEMSLFSLSLSRLKCGYAIIVSFATPLVNVHRRRGRNQFHHRCVVHGQTFDVCLRVSLSLPLLRLPTLKRLDAMICVAVRRER